MILGSGKLFSDAISRTLPAAIVDVIIDDAQQTITVF
jgi:hypothetical protein